MPDSSPLSDAQAQRLITLYDSAEKEILKEVNRLLLKNPESYSLAWQKTLLARVQQIRADLLSGSRTWCQEAIPDSYMKGVAWADSEALAGSKLAAGFGSIHEQAAQVLADNAYSRLQDVNSVVGRRVDDVFRSVALEHAKGSVIGYQTTAQTARHIREDLSARGITGFVDKAGHEWSLGRYAKVLAQETTNGAFRQGTINRLQERGHDLVRLSSHSGSCPKCTPWQGRTMSLSGADGYPSVDEARGAGVFHPGCLHILSLAPEERDRYVSSIGKKGTIIDRESTISDMRGGLLPLDSKQYFGFRSELRSKLDQQIVLKNLSDQDVAKLNSKIKEYDSICDKLRIPRYRGIVDAPANEKSLASMGDGVLAVTEDVFKNNGKVEAERLIKLNTKRIAEKEEFIKRNRETIASDRARWEKNNARLMADGIKFEDSSFYKGSLAQKNANDNLKYQKEIDGLSTRIADLKARGENALINKWKPGMAKEARPWGADEYFDFSKHPDKVLDHEFGHHIHQQLGATSKNWKNPPVEKDIDKIYNSAKKKKDFISPSEYGDSDPQEWFAESYLLHKNGRDDLVDSRLLKYMEEKGI